MTPALLLAGRSLRRSPGRSLLMGLGLVVGVASITLTSATGEGARRAVRDSFRSMIGALDILLVEPGGAAQRGMTNPESAITTLTVDDASAIGAQIPNVRAVGMEQFTLDASVEAGGHTGTTALFGVSPNWGAIRDDSIVAGRYVTADDDRAASRVAVIGADVAREYFAGTAVGQTIRLAGVDFEVIGVLSANGAGPGGISMDNLVYVPLGTTTRRIFNHEYLNLISIKLTDPARWAETKAAVTSLLRNRHATAATQLADFRVSSPEAMIASMTSVDTTLRTALTWVGVLAMLIGGVVVANLMFASSVSRRIEIATRRAVGASRRDILRQFWAEALLVSFLAAVGGALVSVGVTDLGAAMMHAPLAVAWPVVWTAIVVAVAVGGVAGWLPAMRAAARSPAVALRDAG